MNQAKKNRLPLYIGIPVILLLLFVRFGLYFLKSDGFSGLSMLLPVLLLGFILFALCTSALFAAWVYQDCKDLLSAPFRDQNHLSRLRTAHLRQGKLLRGMRCAY